MWLLVPVLLGSVYFMAFTWMGEAAFFWGVIMLLAALVGSVAQMVEQFHRCRTGGSVSLPA
jgi:hypothetical protein